MRRGNETKVMRIASKTVDDYVAAFPKPVGSMLQKVRAALHKALPGAEEAISYGIPVLKLNGRPVVYFAGWKEHYSLYPMNKRMEAAFAKDLAKYKISGKGTVRFPLSKPIPVGFIQRIAKFRARENAEAAKAKRPAARRPAAKPRRRG
jgi:uncharacterized protein YdhG (YjbR/CyaY superfamily)